MASTTFASGTTIASTWLNTVNDRAYEDAINVKNYGATGDGSTDDTSYINLAIVAANSSGRNLFFPQGDYKVTASTTQITAAIRVFGVGLGSRIFTDVASVSLIRINATTDLFGGEVVDLWFDSPTGAATTKGILINASASKYVALMKFSRIHFTGVKTGISIGMTTTVVSGSYNVIPFSNNNFSNLTFTKNAASNYCDYGIKWDSGCGPHNVVSTANFQCSISGIQAGDGTAGLGDFIVSSCHFNFATDAIKLTGPTTLTEYRNNVVISNCQFDGGVTTGCNFLRMSQFQLIGNIYGGSIHNSFTGQVDNAGVEENNIESRFSYSKSIVGTGSTTVDIGKLVLTDATLSSYGSAYCEVVGTCKVQGVGQGVTVAGFNVNWNAGTCTFTRVTNYETPASTVVINGTVASNELKIQVTTVPTASPNTVYGNVRIVGPFVKWTYL